MRNIFEKLTEGFGFQIRFHPDGDQSTIRILSKYHETDIKHFFDYINLADALYVVSNADFSLVMKYYTRPKNADNPLTVLVSMKHIIYFKTEGNFMARIIECFNEQLKDDYYCINKLNIYPYYTCY